MDLQPATGTAPTLNFQMMDIEDATAKDATEQSMAADQATATMLQTAQHIEDQAKQRPPEQRTWWLRKPGLRSLPASQCSTNCLRTNYGKRQSRLHTEDHAEAVDEQMRRSSSNYFEPLGRWTMRLLETIRHSCTVPPCDFGCCGAGIVVVAVQPAHSQFGIDLAAILAGLKEINSTLNSAVGSPLRVINQVEQEEQQFQRQVLYPLGDRQRPADGDGLSNSFPNFRQLAR